jgi:hypothetical protein
VDDDAVDCDMQKAPIVAFSDVIALDLKCVRIGDD